MRVAFPILSRPFTTAILISSVVHAAIALSAPDTSPLNDDPEVGLASSQGRPLHVALAQQPSTVETMPQWGAAALPQKPVSSPSPSTIAATERMISSSKAAAARDLARRSLHTLAESSEQALEQSADETSEPLVKPTPLSYPILVFPPGDDPHRVGVVRLLLVVSSEGKVVNVIVTASTMSQDYIDRVTKSAEEMRFNPGLLRGSPHAGWYEVVVNFAFEPQSAM